MRNAETHRQRKKGGLQDKDPYFSRSSAKTLEALEIFKREAVPLPLGQFAKRLALTKTSAFRILHTLERTGYALRMPDGCYMVAPERRAGSGQLLNMLLRAAEDPMKDLNRVFGETVSAALLFDNHIEVVAVIESPHTVKMSNIVGRILPPHASSLGKAITASQPEAVREKLLRCYGVFRFTPTTITDEIALQTELDTIRTRGYATDNEESTPGGFCFAAPLVGSGGEVVAALSISVPAIRMESQNHAKIIEALRKSANLISHSAGIAVSNQFGARSARRVN